MRSTCRFVLLLLACSAAPLRAQTVPDAPAPQPPPVPPVQTTQQITVTAPSDTEILVPRLPGESDEHYAARVKAEGNHEVKTEEQQRILVVVPNFTTVIGGIGVPLTPSQKTRLAVRTTLDPYNLVGAFVLAGLNELNGSYRGYGWGPDGYFKRVGAQVANVSIGTMLAGSVYPILLHQDPRYFRMGGGPVKLRMRHALLSAFLCRGDSGHTQVNFSNLGGNFSAGLLSNLYYPPGSRGIGLALTNSSIVTLEGDAGNIALEFSPDVAAWWNRHHSRSNPPAPAPPPSAPPASIP